MRGCEVGWYHGPDTARPLTGAAALRWDMEVLSQEQALIQPLYLGVSQATRDQLRAIATMSGVTVNAGNLLTGGDNVAAGPHHREGEIPAFPEGDSMTSVDDRWRYGMRLGNQFAPQGTGYVDGATQRPAAGAAYTDGTALAAANTRPHLHMLDAEIDDGMGMASISRITALLGQFTDAERLEFARDRMPGGSQYSGRLAMIPRVRRETVTAALPASGPERTAFLENYNRSRPAGR